MEQSQLIGYPAFRFMVYRKLINDNGPMTRGNLELVPCHSFHTTIGIKGLACVLTRAIVPNTPESEAAGRKSLDQIAFYPVPTEIVLYIPALYAPDAVGTPRVSLRVHRFSPITEAITLPYGNLNGGINTIALESVAFVYENDMSHDNIIALDEWPEMQRELQNVVPPEVLGAIRGLFQIAADAVAKNGTPPPAVPPAPGGEIIQGPWVAPDKTKNLGA